MERYREAEERRRARRVSPEGRAERRQSRSEFRGQGRDEALRLAREKHRELVEAPVWEPLDLPAGSRVERFFGEFGAQVERPDGSRGAVDSTLPLRSDVGEGPKRLADLDLVDRGGAFVAENPLVVTRIPKRPMDGVEVGGDGFAVGLESPSASEASVVEGRAFTANVLTDTDMVVAPTPRGVQISFQVRSADAPEEATLPVDLPAGAVLRLVGEDSAGAPGELGAAMPGSAEVVRGEEVLASIQAPVAWDADGEPLEDVRHELRGDELAVHFPHRSEDLLYPLVVDPQVDRFRINENGTPIGNGSYVIGHRNDAEKAAWNFNVGGNGGQNYGEFPGQLDYTSEYNGALLLANKIDQAYYFENNAYGQWTWQAPRQSWIYRADFVNLHFDPTFGAEAQCVTEGIYSITRYNWEANATYGSPPAGGPSYPGPWRGGPAPAGSCSRQSFDSKSHFNHVSPTPGNFSVLQLFAFGSGVRYNQAFAQLDGAAVHLDDGQNPSITGTSTTPGGWVRSATVTTTVNTRDAPSGVAAGQGGLGMFVTALFPPTENGSAQLTQFANCHLRLSRCPESQGHTFTYSTDQDLDPRPENPGVQRVREGAHTITGDTYDAANKRTGFTAGTVRVDRSVPQAEVSGFADGELLRDRDYTVTGSGSDPVSGVRSVVVRLDGVQKASRGSSTSPCANAANASCPVSFTLDGGDQALAEGQHTVQTTVTDLAGNTQTASRNFRVERAGPEIAAEGSLRPEDRDWVPRGEQSVAIDVADPGTGAVYAQLLIDGEPVDELSQECAEGGCTLTGELRVDTDDVSPEEGQQPLADGPHEAAVVGRDAAGNESREQWTFRQERTPPELDLSGSLPEQQGQSLTAGQTYDLLARATEPAAGSGLGRIDIVVDDDEPDGAIEASCTDCSIERAFEYVVDDWPAGAHSVTVVATDRAGNQAVQSVEFSNPPDPEAACDVPPAPAEVLDPLPVVPAVARLTFDSEAGLPEAFDPSTVLELDGTEYQPRWDSSDADQFVAAGVFGGARADRDAADGVTLTVEGENGIACFTPTEVGSGVSEPTDPNADPINPEPTTLVANTLPATDTAIRPSATGLDAFLQLRSAVAPTQFSWQVDTAEGLSLAERPDGSVEVVRSAEPGTEPYGVFEPAPVPTVAEQRQAIPDTARNVTHAEQSLDRSQGSTADEVIAIIRPPWAKAADGTPIATSLAAEGSTVTLTVPHGPLTSFPVVADLNISDVEAVDTATAAKATHDTAEWTEEDEASYDDSAVVQESSAPAAAAGSQSTTADEQTLAGDFPDVGSADQIEFGSEGADVDPEAPTAGDPSTTENAEATAANARDLTIGLSESDPFSVTDNDAPDLGASRPLRPFVFWNIIHWINKVENGEAVSKCASRAVQNWKKYVESIGGLNVRVLVTFSRRLDAADGCPEPPAPPAPTYKKAVGAFLDRYQFVRRIAAYNEPEFTSRDETANTIRLPERVGKYWIAANNLCHEKNGKRDRCGSVVAGEYAGGRGEYVFTRTVPRPGRDEQVRIPYRETVRKWIFNHSPYRPLIWSFHAWSDVNRFLLNEDRVRYSAPVIAHFRRLFATRYRLRNGNRPAVWLTEIGAPYRMPCQSINIGDSPTKRQANREELCKTKTGKNAAGQPVVLRHGELRQRNAAAFLIRKVVGRLTLGRRGGDFAPPVRRIYYYNLEDQVGHRFNDPQGNPTIASGRCRTESSCPQRDSGLVGAVVDDKTAAQQGLGIEDYDRFCPDLSTRGARRPAYRVLRNKLTSQAATPKRCSP